MFNRMVNIVKNNSKLFHLKTDYSNSYIIYTFITY
jgi:hypothetical protein